MSFQGAATATVAAVPASTSSVTLFTNDLNVRGRSVWNAGTVACFLTYGTVSSTTLYTTQIATGATYTFPEPVYTGVVTGIWSAAATGTAFTTEWTGF